jgi:hypothetical protein
MNNIATLLGLRDANGDPETEVRARMTAEDHRVASAAGLRLLRGGGRVGSVDRRVRRINQADQRRFQKRATRNVRRERIAELQDTSTVLGIARVYLEGAGNPAMRRNVGDHVAAMSQQLARRDHPEFWTEDVLSPEDHLRQISEALDEAQARIVGRLREVLNAHR